MKRSRAILNNPVKLINVSGINWVCMFIIWDVWIGPPILSLEMQWIRPNLFIFQRSYYRHRLCTATAPFWFSTEHRWIVIMPFWLSTNWWYDLNVCGLKVKCEHTIWVRVFSFVSVIDVITMFPPIKSGDDTLLFNLELSLPRKLYIHVFETGRS